MNVGSKHPNLALTNSVKRAIFLPMRYALKNIELLKVVNPSGASTIGGSQLWYRERWPRISGCGPTAASNIIWYYARSRPKLCALCDVGGADRTHFLRLMDEMFTFVTPGVQGVNSAAIFSDGMARYGAAHGAKLKTHTLEAGRSADANTVRDFIARALENDAPAAFLNLSNGMLDNLESWHWVTIIAMDESMTASIADQGRVLEIDLGRWLETSRLGGALVYAAVD